MTIENAQILEDVLSSAVVSSLGQPTHYLPLHKRVWIRFLRGVRLESYAEAQFKKYTHNLDFVEKVFRMAYRSLQQKQSYDEGAELLEETKEGIPIIRCLEHRIEEIQNTTGQFEDYLADLRCKQGDLHSDIQKLEQSDEHSAGYLISAAQGEYSRLSSEISDFEMELKQKKLVHNIAVSVRDAVQDVIVKTRENASGIKRHERLMKYVEGVLGLVEQYR